MNFVFIGFSQTNGVRRLAFERIGAGNLRTPFTVAADLLALQKFGIHLQELPLLCRRVLECAPEGSTDHSLSLTNDQMRDHAATTAPAPARRPFKSRTKATAS